MARECSFHTVCGLCSRTAAITSLPPEFLDAAGPPPSRDLVRHRFVYAPFITAAKIRNGFFMCSEARMFAPYHSNPEALADDARFDLYRYPGVHLSGSNVFLTSTILLLARPR